MSILFPKIHKTNIAKLHRSTIFASLYVKCLWFKLVLYTGTRLYRNTGLVALISEPVFPLLSIRYSFRYIFSLKCFKMHEVYVFCGEQGQKLECQLLFCFELDVSALLQAWDWHSAREFKRFPLWTTWREGILAGICPIKQCFCCN